MKVCTLCKFVATLLCLYFSISTQAQSYCRLYGRNTPNTCQSSCNQPSNERTYGIIYSADYKGDYEMIGNTLLRSSNVADMNDNSLGNYRNMVYVDADGVSSTSNSSAASLNLPAGSTIEFARIYWGGMVYCQYWNASKVQSVKVKKDNGAYTTWTALRMNQHPNDYNRNQIEYMAYIDVTDWLKTVQASSGSANGTYWVADIDATPGNFAQSGAYGGWTLVVAYKNSNSALHSIRLYDGYQNVFDEGHTYMNTINLNNLDVPSGTSSARLGVAVWEGDGSITGDYMKLNGTKVSNSVNSVNNIWSGTISGATTSSTRTPSYANQMAVDLDQFDVSSLVKGGDKTAQLIFGTTGDSYYPGVICFSSKFNTPMVTLTKTVANENGSKFLTAGRVIYTLTATNTSASTGYNSYIIDSIPPDLILPASPVVQLSTNNGASWSTYSNFSVGTVSGQQVIKLNIGSGATTFNGGTLTAGQKVLLRLYGNVVSTVEPITNLATVYTHDVSGNTYVDESTAIINPGTQSPLPATFSDFSVSRSNNAAKLQWTTLTEAYNKTFDVERSTDAVNFTTIGTVNGSGSSESVQQYDYLDPLNGITSSVVYYRLKLNSIDGNATYTKIVALKLDKGSLNNFTVYPNPFRGDLKLTVESEKETTVKLQLSSASGQTVWSRTLPVQKGSNILVLDQLATVKAGSYILQLTMDDQVLTQQVVKQ